MNTRLVPALVLAAGLLAPTALASPQSTPCSGGQVFDDGTAERLLPSGIYIGPSELGLVSLFAPPSYPFTYDSVCLFLYGSGALDVVVYDDDGTAGDPGTLLRSVRLTVSAPSPGWLTCDLGGVVVASGSVWIGVHRPASEQVYLGADTNSVHPFRWATWELVPLPIVWQSTFGTLGPAALMVRVGGTPAATAVVRNGSGLDPLCYTAQPPRLGQSWTARVFHDSVARQTRVYFQALPATGPVLPMGELLVDPASPRYFTSVRASSALSDAHVYALPADAALLGLHAASQALVIEPGRLALCNAVDLTFGF